MTEDYLNAIRSGHGPEAQQRLECTISVEGKQEVSEGNGISAGTNRMIEQKIYYSAKRIHHSQERNTGDATDTKIKIGDVIVSSRGEVEILHSDIEPVMHHI